MPRRVSLPAADELFRTTGGAGVQPSAPREHPEGEEPPAVPRVPAPSEESRAEEAAERAERPGAGERDESSAPTTAGRTAAPVPAQAQRRTGPPGRTSTTTGTGTAATNGQGPAAGAQRRARAPRRPSGRERHDEKITVYVSAEELMDLEHARLVLRGEHGLAVDRGRIVREAVAVVLADLESRGDASILVRRLRGR